MTTQNSSQANGNFVTVIYNTKEVLEKNIPYIGEMPSPEKCQYCGRTLYYEGLFLMGRIMTWKINSPERCTCEKAKKYWVIADKEVEKLKCEREELDKAKKQREKYERLLKYSGIKERFLDRTFEKFRIDDNNRIAYEVSKEYADSFKDRLNDGMGLYLEGTCGTGKTHLAVAIAMQLLSKGFVVLCHTSIDLLLTIRKAFDTETDYSESEILKKYTEADLLIIDDLGKENPTKWGISTLYSIINERYERYKPTLITTNYNDKSFIERLTLNGGDAMTAKAIISRLRECTRPITMAFEDRRGKK